MARKQFGNVRPAQLKPHPENERILGRRRTRDYKDLMADIEHEGAVLTPLLVTEDGTIFAGERRWRAAKELGLPTVPVRYIEKPKSAAKERELIVRENFSHGHTPDREKIKAYERMWPDFWERLARQGKPTKQTSSGILTAGKIAKATGQSLAAVQRQLHRYAKSKGRSKTKQADPQRFRRDDQVRGLLRIIRFVIQGLAPKMKPEVTKALKELVRELEE